MKNEEEHTHIDVICIDVVICAFQNDPRGIICRGSQEDNKSGYECTYRKRENNRQRRKKRGSRGGKKKSGGEVECVMGRTKGSSGNIFEDMSRAETDVHGEMSL